jgi:hypothetical protein
MGIERFYTTPVTILAPQSRTDRYGDVVVDDWTNASSTRARGWLARLSAQEVLDAGRDANVTGWKLYLPPGTAIAANNRVVADGTTYEVDGPPLEAKRPTGTHHLEVLLRLVEG